MRPEVKAAAEWWTNQIKKEFRLKDNGDSFQTMAATLASAIPIRKLPELTPVQIHLFRAELASLLEASIIEENWRPANPIWGSAFRVVSIDYGIGDMHPLSIAAKVAGIPRVSDRLPIKTTMWINPGIVKVACGYSAPIMYVYGSKEKEEECYG